MRFKSLLVILALCSLTTWAQSPKREFRATWFTTHYSIDWPSTKAVDDATRKTQKKQLTDILDMLQEGNMNACCMQVRSLCDACYRSSYEPWSSQLTGTRGQDPGYDPLAFAIEEAHKRGIELHVWVNPFRYETSAGAFGENDKVRKNCKQWIISYNNGSYSGTIIDPGFPEARNYVIKVLMEIIHNYDVDGILMDDYFYPYGGTTKEDATSLNKYKPTDQNAADWRRENVDKCMKQLYDSIQACKPWVRFGMGPFGVWTNQSSVAKKYGISLPKDIYDLDDYEVQFCNTVEWVKGGYVDYIAPQLYWPTTSKNTDYDVLCKWWAQDVCKHFSDMLPDGKKVHAYVSQAAYRFGSAELGLQIDDNREFAPFDAPGSIFYNTASYKHLGVGYNDQNVNEDLSKKLKASKFTEKALPPAMDWKKHETLSAPTDVNLAGTTLTWKHAKAERFTVYAYPKSMKKDKALGTSKYLLGIVYGKSLDVKNVANYDTKTFAVCALDRYGNEFESTLYNEGEPLPDVNVTGVSMQKEVVVQLGDEYQLTPTITPANATNTEVTWTVEDASVVAVSSTGIISTLKTGETNVTVKTDDGGFTATCHVTVTVSVTKVSLGRAHALTLRVGQTKTISAVISPSNAVNKNVSWTTSDAQVATVESDGLSATITAIAPGEATITVKTEEGGLTDECVVTVPQTESAVDDVNSAKYELIATADGLYIDLQGQAQVAVYNADGRLIDAQSAKGEYTCHLAKGIYVVTINNEKYKFIK